MQMSKILSFLPGQSRAPSEDFVMICMLFVFKSASLKEVILIPPPREKVPAEHFSHSIEDTLKNSPEAHEVSVEIGKWMSIAQHTI